MAVACNCASVVAMQLRKCTSSLMWRIMMERSTVSVCVRVCMYVRVDVCVDV